MSTSNAVARLERARLALDGLSVGDAFGERFFAHWGTAEKMVAERALPRPPWHFTDDTLMALSVVSVLRRFGKVEQDVLARDFAARYDVSRGYGPAMHGMLENIRLGVPWQAASRWLFEGQGSFGNGAAMRVAPLGAYFADDLALVIEQARLSAEVTHAHPEGVAGAVAVAVAAALAWQARGESDRPDRRAFLDRVLGHVPDSIVREKIRHARDLDAKASVLLAVAALGNGTGVSAQDTVPFALWCAGEQLGNFEEAL